MRPQASGQALASAIVVLTGLATALGAQEVATSLRPQARPVALEATAEPAPTANAADDAAIDTSGTDPAHVPETITAPDPATPDAATIPTDGPVLGPETNLPLPRYVSLKTSEGNVRRGPSLSHRIDWVFVREDMPLQITAEYGNWRRVVDREGLGGWVHYSLLSGSRTVIVDEDMLPLRVRPEPDAPEVARLEQGVIARLGECQPDWCRLTAGGYRGWAPKTALWGVGPDEILE